MQMVSMKREDEPAEYEPMPPAAFSYGLRIRLGLEELEKLGLAELPAVRKVVDVQAKAVVISATDDGEYQCLELQITDLGLKPRAESVAGMLYDKE